MITKCFVTFKRNCFGVASKNGQNSQGNPPPSLPKLFAQLYFHLVN